MIFGRSPVSLLAGRNPNSEPKRECCGHLQAIKISSASNLLSQLDVEIFGDEGSVVYTLLNQFRCLVPEIQVLTAALREIFDVPLDVKRSTARVLRGNKCPPWEVCEVRGCR